MSHIGQDSVWLIWSGPIAAVLGLMVGAISNIREARSQRRTIATKESNE